VITAIVRIIIIRAISGLTTVSISINKKFWWIPVTRSVIGFFEFYLRIKVDLFSLDVINKILDLLHILFIQLNFLIWRIFTVVWTSYLIVIVRFAKVECIFELYLLNFILYSLLYSFWYFPTKECSTALFITLRTRIYLISW